MAVLHHPLPRKVEQRSRRISRHPPIVAAALYAIRELVSEYDVIQCCHVEDAPQIASAYALNKLGSVTFDHVASAAQADKEYQALLKLISNGFPEKRNLVEPACLSNYWEVRHRLSIFRGVALLDNRLVIPQQHYSQQPPFSQSGHHGHEISCTPVCILARYG